MARATPTCSLSGRTLRVSDHWPTVTLAEANDLMKTKTKKTAKRASGSLQPDCCAVPLTAREIRTIWCALKAHQRESNNGGSRDYALEDLWDSIQLKLSNAEAQHNAGTQRPGSPDGSLATETRKPGSLK